MKTRPIPLAKDANHKTVFWFLWPTTTFGFLPGAPAISVTTTLPIGAGSTIRRFHNFMLPGAMPDEAKIAYGQAVLIPEDIAICESVQRGLASRGYAAGRFVHDPGGGHMTEAAVHHFHQFYAAAMGF